MAGGITMPVSGPNLVKLDAASVVLLGKKFGYFGIFNIAEQMGGRPVSLENGLRLMASRQYDGMFWTRNLLVTNGEGESFKRGRDKVDKRTHLILPASEIKKAYEAGDRELYESPSAGFFVDPKAFERGKRGTVIIADSMTGTPVVPPSPLCYDMKTGILATMDRNVKDKQIVRVVNAALPPEMVGIISRHPEIPLKDSVRILMRAVPGIRPVHLDSVSMPLDVAGTYIHGAFHKVIKPMDALVEGIQ